MPLSTQQLETLRQTIDARCRALADELRGDAERAREDTVGALAGPVTDSADEASAGIIADLDQAELSRDLAELRALEAARKRLAAGGFGRCADCGEDIVYKRLAVEPAALRCIDCQRVHEKTYAHPREPKL